jgi:hypothetical protein
MEFTTNLSVSSSIKRRFSFDEGFVDGGTAVNVHADTLGLEGRRSNSNTPFTTNPEAENGINVFVLVVP